MQGNNILYTGKGADEQGSWMMLCPLQMSPSEHYSKQFIKAHVAEWHLNQLK